MVLENNMKMWKNYDNNKNNDDDGQRTNCDHKSSGELKQLKITIANYADRQNRKKWWSNGEGGQGTSESLHFNFLM